MLFRNRPFFAREPIKHSKAKENFGVGQPNEACPRRRHNCQTSQKLSYTFYGS
ncbi:hypothetical protein BVRB_9g211690 [Beta vulgaris subsp. vulgaris]|nr:hypothetical protein BVRB_9g211690 [Beta vulgaris subsp. vulgaris]